MIVVEVFKMILETVTYRAVEVKTDFLLDLAGIKSSQGMSSKEVEACVLGLFPKWRGLKIFVQVPVFDDAKDMAISSICIELTRTKLENPEAPFATSFATLVTSDPVTPKDIAHVDGALLFIMEQTKGD
jgi:hypothetical protein